MDPRYTTIASVKIRLEGKVRFQADPSADPVDGELSDELLLQLIRDAETEVEMDLRGRYAIPFRSLRSGSFSALPDHTQRALRKVVDLQAVMQVLDTDFGRSGNVDASKYYENTEKRYEDAVKKLLGKGFDDKKKTPPLEDLLLAQGNGKSDDGYKGMLINTDQDLKTAELFAEDHINDPSQVFPSLRNQ